MPETLLPVEDAAGNIVDYHDGLTRITANIQDMRDRSGAVVDDLSVVRRAIDKVDAIRDDVGAFGDDIDKLQLVFKLMGKAGPLKSVAKIGEDMLKRVETTTDRIESKIDGVARKIEDSGINRALEKAIGQIEKVDGKLAEGQSFVTGQRDSFKGVADVAAKAYVVADQPIRALGTVMDTPAEIVAEINAAYADITGRIDGFNDRMPSGNFGRLLTVEADLARVFGVLDDIRGPLDAVYSVLKPIEPILNAVGLITKFTVDPVIDWILKTLKIDDLINSASDRITAFLPDVDFFDGLSVDIDVALVELDGISLDGAFERRTYDDDGDELVNEDGSARTDDTGGPIFPSGVSGTPRIEDPFGIGQWVKEQIENKLINTTEAVTDEAGTVIGYALSRIGSLDADGLGVFVEIPAPLKGSDDDDLLSADVGGLRIRNVMLVGDDEDNVITAYDGDNVFYGAGGDDTLIGDGEGAAVEADADAAADADDGDEIEREMETAVFTGPIEQYVLTWADPEDHTSELTVEHVSPLEGVSFDGTDVLRGIEQVTFLGTRDPQRGDGQALTRTVKELQESLLIKSEDFTASPPPEPTPETPDPEPTNYIIIANYEGMSGSGISLTGANGDDLIFGDTGNDRLTGLDGDDTLSPGGDYSLDTIDGGDGRDLFLVNTSLPFLRVDLEEGSGLSVRGEGAAFWTLIDMEDVTASAGDRAVVYGDDDAAGNVLRGGRVGDALHGRGGTDLLDGAEGRDTLVGGIGRDTLNGGAGDDHLIATDDGSGWAAATDPATGLPLGEQIIGGPGFDTAWFSTILDDTGPRIGTIRGMWEGPLAASGRMWGTSYEADRVEMQKNIVSTGWIDLRQRDPGDGTPDIVEVHRMSDRDDDGASVLLGVDTLQGVEKVSGTNGDDILRGLTGDAALQGLAGSYGDDTIYAEDATGTISGDAGRDRVVASARLVPQSSGDEAPQDSGVEVAQDSGDAPAPAPGVRSFLGDGSDTLDLSDVADVRWSVWTESRRGSVSDTYIQAYDAEDGQVVAGGVGGSIYARDKFVGFGTLRLGDGDDVIEMPAARVFDISVLGGDGDDELSAAGIANRPVTTLLGETGNDTLTADSYVRAEGGTGDDVLVLRGNEATVEGGAGDDTVEIGSADDGTASGGEGVDFLTPGGSARSVRIDFAGGTFVMDQWESGESSHRIDGFEAMAGSARGDGLFGGASNDQIVGAGGGDTLWGGDLDRRADGPNGTPGNAIDGIGQFLAIGGDHAAALDGGWTAAATISNLSGAPGFQRIVTAQAETGTQAFSLAVRDGKAHLRADLDGAPPVVIEDSGTIDLTDGAEHALAASYDAEANLLRLWVDGVLIGEAAPAAAPRSAVGEITVGAFDERFAQHLEAEVAQVEVWDSAVAGPDWTGGPDDPYLSLRAVGDRDDILAPDAEIAQGGRAQSAFELRGETSGADALYGGAGADDIRGGDGDDFLHAGGPVTASEGPVDSLDGGRGRDTASFAFAGLGTDLRAEIGADVLAQGFDAVGVDLALGEQRTRSDDVLRANLRGIENVIGTHLDDLLAGDAGDNVLNGGEGDDMILGRAGNDVITALGADVIDAGAGDDTVGVSLADATIDGGTGTNVLIFEGDDTIEGADGALTPAARFTYDLVAGTYSGDVSEARPIWAEDYEGVGGGEPRSDGTTVLTPRMVQRADPEQARTDADASRDVPVYDPALNPEGEGRNPTDFRIDFTTVEEQVSGEIFNFNTVRGGSGKGSEEADDLTGSAFGDAIEGRGGDDTISGLAGDDTLTGGAGADVFALTDGMGDDTVTDWEEGIDAVDASRLTGDNAASAVESRNDDGHRVLTIADGSTLTLIGEPPNSDPEGEVVLTGDAAIGGTLVADASGVSDGNGIVADSAGGQWLRDGAGIADATATTYVVTPEDVGATISYLFSYEDGGGTRERVESAGTDPIATGRLIEGGPGPNVLQGGAGNDTLDGGTGPDEMRGDAGDDLYIVDEDGDVVRDTSGLDTVRVDGDVRFGLAGTGVERVEVQEGARGVWILGDGTATEMVGNEAVNVLASGGGADTMTGGGGADYFAFQQSDPLPDAVIVDFDRDDKLLLDDRFFGRGDGRVTPREISPDEVLELLFEGLAAYGPRTGNLSVDTDGPDGPGGLEVIATFQSRGGLGLDDVMLF